MAQKECEEKMAQLILHCNYTNLPKHSSLCLNLQQELGTLSRSNNSFFGVFFVTMIFTFYKVEELLEVEGYR